MSLLFLGLIVGLFSGMLISDVLWLRKMGILSLWKAHYKYWKATK